MSERRAIHRLAGRAKRPAAIRPRRWRRVLIALSLVLAVGGGVALTSASSAGAAAGAVGSLDSANAISLTGISDGAAIRLSGWAYNPRTKPVQDVAIYIQRASDGRQIWVGTVEANQSRPDVVKAGISKTPYVGFSTTVYVDFRPTKAFAVAFDSGERSPVTAISLTHSGRAVVFSS